MKRPKFKKQALCAMLSMAMAATALPGNVLTTYAAEEAIVTENAEDKYAVTLVIGYINSIGTVEYTEECKAKIDAARKAFDALTDVQKDGVYNIETLTQAEEAFKVLEEAANAEAAYKAVIQDVIDKITAIGEVAYTEECKALIDTARASYDALSDEQKAEVTNLETLTAAETAYAALKEEADKKAAEEKAIADAEAAKAVEEIIDAIGEVAYTEECKAKIDAALEAYAALTADQQILVTNFETLSKANEDYNALKSAEEKKIADAAAVLDAQAKIEAIGTVEYTEECKAKIDAARAAYDALEEELKLQITNYETLTKAEEEYAQLKIEADKLAAVEDAIDKIADIGTVEYTDECKAKIKAAREAYDALSEELKEQVTNLETLEEAEAAYEELRKEANDVVKKFKDIKGGEWFQAAVQFVYDREIMVGVGKRFKPNAVLTREQFVQTLYGYFGKPGTDENGNNFADIKMEWYVPAVCWASQNGIVSGFSDGKGGTIFGIGKEISRQDIVVMLYRFAKFKGLDVTTQDGYIDGYKDADVVAEYAKEAMNWAVSMGIINGKGAAEETDKSKIALDPLASATRAECAQIIKNFAEKTEVN